MSPADRQSIVADGNWTIPEARKVSGLSRTALYAWMGRGELPYVKIGRRRLIPRRALLALMERNLVARDGD